MLDSLEHLAINSLAHNRLSILIYHRVLGDGESGFGDPDQRQFYQQMNVLRKSFNVITLKEAREYLSNGWLPKRAAVITFDDGYHDNYSRALPVLQKLGLRATFFIATDYLDGGVMWNDLVTYGLLNSKETTVDLSAAGLDKQMLGAAHQRLSVVRNVLSEIKRFPQVERQRLALEICNIAGGKIPDHLMMTTEELRHMQKAGMEIGGHTCSHPILSTLSDEQAFSEISKGKSYLEKILDEEVVSFAYPNGKPGVDYNKRHTELVKNAGFKCAVSTSWGVTTEHSDHYQLPRFTPWDKSPGKFKYRLYRNLFNRKYEVAL